MIGSVHYSIDYEVGDLVIILHSIEFQGQVAETGELGLVIKIHPKKFVDCIYDCRVKLKCGGELDVWFGEIHKLT